MVFLGVEYVGATLLEGMIYLLV